MFQQLNLQKHTLLKGNSFIWLAVEQGSVWITFENDPNDYILEAGQQMELIGIKPIVEAMTDARISIPGKTLQLKIKKALPNQQVFSPITCE